MNEVLILQIVGGVVSIIFGLGGVKLHLATKVINVLMSSIEEQEKVEESVKNIVKQKSTEQGMYNVIDKLINKKGYKKSNLKE